MNTSKLYMSDFYFNDAGDFRLDKGDFAVTQIDDGVALAQEIQDRIKSYPGEWLVYPTRGSIISEAQGSPNNRETHSAIEDAIRMALTFDLFLNQDDFSVLVAPVSTSQVAVRIDFSDQGLSRSSRRQSTVKIIYDLDGTTPYIGRM